MALEGVPRMEFDVTGVSIDDACATRLREVEARFAPLLAAPRTQLMIDAADLSFSDPGLSAEVRRRLDAAESSGAVPTHD